MALTTRVVDFLSLRSERPARRLLGYYVGLAVVIIVLAHIFDVVDRTMMGARTDRLLTTPQLLEDGLATGVAAPTQVANVISRVEYAISVLVVLLGTLAFMLPVSWVYMSAHKDRVHNQSVAQTLIILPLVVGGIVMVVQNSLALAFSLAGVVAAVRFRTALTDTRDTVFIFLSIAIGFAAGIQVLIVGGLLSLVFNMVVVMMWRTDYGRNVNVLEPTAGSQWTEPLKVLSAKDEAGDEKVPDRDLVLALTPSKVEALADRFNRVKGMLGSNGKKPRYNAVVSITTYVLSEAQQKVEEVLEQSTKRWKLDEVITNTGKPSQMYFLIRMRKSVPRDALLTAIRASANGAIQSADILVGDAAALEQVEKKEQKKLSAKKQ